MTSKRFNNPPAKKELIWNKLLITSGIVSIIFFLGWFINSNFIGHKVLYVFLLATFIYKITVRLYEWWFCWHLSTTIKPSLSTNWKVDVLTTYCAGEPKDMLYTTLNAIKNIHYPHETFLCDEADDMELKKFCAENNIHHVTRTIKVNAKAGNINNALNTVANGDICLILDPDHIPTPNFLDEVLPYFENEEIGFVQVPQIYYNQQETILAKAAAQQTYQFYGPFMMGLNSCAAVPAIGANCTFRRKALDSIGGHAPGLTEDMHTAMRLHAKKWKSVYNPVIVAKGLVPSNYSGYCLQQLKWSRGSFDLLLKVLPKIRKNLSWKQLVYYISAPFFYLAGLISILDFLIPIISLFTGIIPIKISLDQFLLFYFPFLLSTFVIRQFNQKWLLEQHEKGAFIFGGTLFKASWWTTSLGLLYSLINKKVPYIPTPKDNKYETPWKLLIPNFIVILTSIIAIVFGLIRDFTPFMIFMATLAFTNVLILTLGNLMAMQHLILWVHKRFKHSFISKGSKTRLWVYEQKQRIFTRLQRSTVLVVLIAVCTYFLFKVNNKPESLIEKTAPINSKDYFIPNLHGDSNLSAVGSNIVCQSFYIDESLFKNVCAFVDTCAYYNKLAFISLDINKAQVIDINNGTNDSIFNKIILNFREQYYPVLISLNTHPSVSDSLLADCYYHLADLSYRNAFPNITWIWPLHDQKGISVLEKVKHNISYYLIQQDSIEKLTHILNKTNAVKPILVKQGNLVFTHQPTKKRLTIFDLSIFKSEDNYVNTVPAISIPYIKGVAYNPGHGWRDHKNTQPLTKEKLSSDFQQINQMGANTIRKYNPSIYDKNVLNAAEDNDLKVIYGFWFDRKDDYSSNSYKLRQYKRKVRRSIAKYKDNKSILGWSLGNETWGLLKKNYCEPYLSVQRMYYVQMINEIAKEVRSIDPTHPIFTMEEHTWAITSAKYAFVRFVSNLNYFGVNSYYEKNISQLDSLMKTVSPEMPYIISEFGPKGYWEEAYTDLFFNESLKEQSSFEKAAFIQQQWNEFIEDTAATNNGAVAFCWQNRYEATATWFGILDIYNHKTPSYYAIQKCFRGDTTQAVYPMDRFLIFGPRDYLIPGSYATFKASSADFNKNKDYLFKWVIYEEESFKLITETKFQKESSDITIKIPTKKSDYRLYLYVTDGNGNSITESYPLIIKWES